MRIGFDLDGVLAEIRVAELELIRIAVRNGADEALLEENYYSSLRPLLDARDFVSSLDDMAVITARPNRLIDVTHRWLRQYYPNVWPRFIEAGDWVNGDPRREVASLKATAIEFEGIEVYIDDDPVVVQFLRTMTSVPIIKFGGRSS